MGRDLKYTRNIGIAAHIDGKTITTERICSTLVNSQIGGNVPKVHPSDGLDGARG